MKTIKQLTERRDEIAARVKELNEGCGGDFATLNDEERTEFDGLSTELGEVDVDLRRAKAVETAAKGATAITQDVASDPEKSRRARGGHAEPTQPKTEKGIAFAQYVKTMYRAKGIPTVALQIAQQQQHLDPRVVRVLKVAVESGSVSGTTTAGNWGMELVGTETGVVADFVDFLRPTTILGKFGANGIPALNRVPFRVPLVGMTDGGTGYWVGEGKQKPLTSFAFSRTHLEPLKVAAICVATKELLADSSPAADGLLRNALAAALRERTDIDFIDPNKTAAAGVSPASITNQVTPIPSSGSLAANVRTDIKALFSTFISSNNAPTSAVWIMSATTALSLSLMMNALGQPEFPSITMNGGTLSGLPVITSEYVPTDSSGGFVILVNANDVYYGDDGDVMVDTSEHASIEMDANPESAGGTLVSMYQTNRVAFRAERRLDWMKRRDSAVAVLSAVAWG